MTRPALLVAATVAALGATALAAQPRAAIDSAALAALLDSVVPAAMRAERQPGAVVAVVAGGRVVLARGWGVADLETRRPMSAESTIVRIGSISKVLTAVAVAQLADRGAIDLRADVNRYLKRLQAPDAFGKSLTAWHLLTHTAALDEIRPGTQAERESELQPLDRFLRGKLVPVMPPGEVTSYSTYGITLAGLLVEDVSGLPFEEYLRRNVWGPLGMRRTSIAVPRADAALVAVPYDVTEGRPVRAPWEWYHTTPASSVNATALDMARFMVANLAGGGGILSPRMTAEMQRQQATVHPRVPGFGLGWQLATTNGERVVEHGGDVAGFSSMLTLLPDRGVGIFVAGHREGSDLRFAVRNAVLDRFFPDRRPREPVTSMHHTRADAARSARRFAGRYRASIFCHTCASPRPMPEVDVVANDDGTLTIWDARWVEVSPAFFRTSDGQRRVGFRVDPSGRATHLGVGSWQVMERVR